MTKLTKLLKFYEFVHHTRCSVQTTEMEIIDIAYYHSHFDTYIFIAAVVR